VLHPITKETDGERETSYLGLNMLVKPHHFLHGRLKIRCSASIHDVYYQSTEKSVEEERPKRLLHSTGTIGGGVPYVHSPIPATDLPPSGHLFDQDTVIKKGNIFTNQTFLHFQAVSLPPTILTEQTAVMATLYNCARKNLFKSVMKSAWKATLNK
jgi:hypothetical protein